jgi:hypothetical protein
VLKNNEPTAVILSLEEYRLLKEAEEDLYLLQIAHQRMQGDWESRTVPAAEVWAKYGLDDADVEDVEIEYE